MPAAFPAAALLEHAFFDAADENNFSVRVAVFALFDLAIAALDHGCNVVEG
jgi:hypothetical protein